jgi:hypothetical protein
MTIISDSELAQFLADKPLYYKLIAVTELSNRNLKYANPLDFKDKPFKFVCPRENEVQTFRTGSPYGSHYFANRIYNDEESAELPLYFDEKSGLLDMTNHVTGICQSCGGQVHFLLRVFSDKSWEKRGEGITITIQKIGQYPSFDIHPDKDVQKYLTEEDLGLYKKALINLSVSYGIGAFAYFRRIIENEIIRIVKDISLIEFEGVDKVKEAYLTFEKNHQMSTLITAINPYLPGSMFINGDNPVQLLYQQLSAGIHSLPEEDCLKRAEMINILLPFVIKKVNEEKYLLKEVAAAMKNLRSL